MLNIISNKKNNQREEENYNVNEQGKEMYLAFTK